MPPPTHAEKLARIAHQLAQHPGEAPLLLRKAPLDQLLEIDPGALTCTAEPGVTFERLVRATLRLGLAPVVVPERRTLTLGEAVGGASFESTSFRHGDFRDSCLEYEVLTGRGARLTCRPEGPHAELFRAIRAGPGLITRLVFRLMPAKRFVKVDYEHCPDLDTFQAAIWERFEAQQPDFVDGFVHSPHHCVLNVGQFVDEAPYTHRYDWLDVYGPSTRERSEDYLPAEQYFFRYDAHPRSFAARLLLGPLLKLLPKERRAVPLDALLPFSRLQHFLEWHEQTIGFYPLWVVPWRRGQQLFIELALDPARARS